MRIYNLGYVRCEYIAVEILLCGAIHLALSVRIRGVINGDFFFDSSASVSRDSLGSIITMVIQVNTSKPAWWLWRKVPNIYVVWRTTPDCPDNGEEFAEKWAQAVHLTTGSLSKEMELLEGEGTLERWPARPQEACRRALFIPLCIYSICFHPFHIFIFSGSSTLHYQPNCLLLLGDCLTQGLVLSPLESLHFCTEAPLAQTSCALWQKFLLYLTYHVMML